jgi:alkaline phosphatase D
MQASSAKHPRLPPGKVLVDNREAEGWQAAILTMVGRFEVAARQFAHRALDEFYELLDKTERAERLD